ncbi:MAG: RNA methyltransferase [Candidatus Amoebophilus sp.]
MKKLSTQELHRISTKEFKNTPKIPLILVLDNLRSMHNIGAAFRIADAFLLEKIYLCGITAQPPHREIHKTALGAEETVIWEYVPDTYTLLQSLKNNGYLIVALEQTDESIPLQNYQINSNNKYALVFGNEVFGIQEEALAACDLALEIPQHGTKHSLNVSVSMGIGIWELTKDKFRG